MPMSLLYAKALFDSIMNSDRRLKTLKIGIEPNNLVTELQAERTRQIIKKFGKDIEEFQSNQMPENIIQLERNRTYVHHKVNE
jgi:hypothetical protein